TRVPFDELAETGFCRRDDEGSPLAPDRLARLRGLWSSPVLGPAGASRRNPMAPDRPEPPTTAVSPTAVTVAVSAEFVLAGSREYIPCTVGVICTEPAVLAALDQ